MDQTQELVAKALQEKFGEETWPVETFAKFVVYRSGQDNALYRVDYSLSKGEVTFSGDPPEEIRRVVSYETVSNEGDPSGSSTNPTIRGEPTMAEALKPKERETIIEDLIENSCCWNEEDRDELTKLSDTALARTKQASDKQAELEALQNAAEQGAAELTAPVANAEQQPTQLTEEQWLAAAPASVRNTLAHAQEAERNEKARLIERITANVSEDAKPEKVTFLNTKNVTELREIASFMPEAASSSRSDESYFVGQPRERAAQNAKIDREDVLTEPDPSELISNSVLKND
jgi:hypothetical protein